MFQSRKLNAHIKILYERTLLVVYRDIDLSFEELQRKGSSISLHQRNVQKLTDLFKGKTGAALELMKVFLSLLMYLII